MTEDEINTIKKTIDEAASYRLWRLENNPDLIIGNYDASHLKAIHGYILQDSTEYYRAGEFRETVPEGYYHSKQRSAYPKGTEVFYSNNPSESGTKTLKHLVNTEDFLL